MDFPNPPGRRSDSNIIPMINVVFLLLIFFLMTARITARMPFDQKLPETTQDTTPADPTDPAFHLGAEGEMAFGRQRGQGALKAAIAEIGNDGRALRLYADARLPARRLVQILSRLRAGGIERINLILARK